MYKLSKILLQLAAEDGAQQAMRTEIERQISEQLDGGFVCQVTHIDANINFDFTKTRITLEGKEIEWED